MMGTPGVPLIPGDGGFCAVSYELHYQLHQTVSLGTCPSSKLSVNGPICSLSIRLVGDSPVATSLLLMIFL